MNNAGTNGDHKRLDGDIRELRDAMRENQATNNAAHDTIKDSLSEMRSSFAGSRWGVRVAWAIAIVLLPALGWLLGSHEARIVDLQIWQASHVTADNDMRDDVNGNADQIERLRSLPRDSDVLRHERE